MQLGFLWPWYLLHTLAMPDPLHAIPLTLECSWARRASCAPASWCTPRQFLHTLAVSLPSDPSTQLGALRFLWPRHLVQPLAVSTPWHSLHTTLPLEPLQRSWARRASCGRDTLCSPWQLRRRRPAAHPPASWTCEWWARRACSRMGGSAPATHTACCR